MTADLDAALADGVLTDDERRALASGLRQLAARADQAARDLTGTGERSGHITFFLLCFLAGVVLVSREAMR